MLIHVAFMSDMTASAVVVSGKIWVITLSPTLFVGGASPQPPKSFPEPTATALQF
jgi:hypothetical protein